MKMPVAMATVSETNVLFFMKIAMILDLSWTSDVRVTDPGLLGVHG
jgi:hypothetical protein